MLHVFVGSFHDVDVKNAKLEHNGMGTGWIYYPVLFRDDGIYNII